MDANTLIDGLIMYLGLVVLLTFHEFGHAWAAWKCGDDTARLQGRLSLNPLAHIDPIGTVLLPLLIIFLSMNGSVLSRFLVGWARPVPVNPSNLRNGRLDDILVTLAGPWMNLLLAIALMGLAKIALVANVQSLAHLSVDMALLSLQLCFFNLLPIPPLDGSQVVRSLIGMSYEAYREFARFGFLILILALQLSFVRQLISGSSEKTLMIIANCFGIPLST